MAEQRTNAVIGRDIPTTLPEIQRLLTSLDRKTQEVEIEARVVAATRNFVRDIGTQLGFGFGSSAVHLGGAPNNGPSPIGNPAPNVGSTGFNSQPGAPYFLSSATQAVPLFSNLAAQS